jgi:hypothetical protein
MDNEKRFLLFVTEMRALAMLLGFLTMALTDVCGTDYYTAASGNISGNIWSTSTNGTPGALPTLVAGDRIFIDDNISITTNYQVMDDFAHTIYLNATIDITGQWSLHTNSQIIFQSSAAKVISSGGGNSDKIKFGNDNTWSGNDGNLTGPGTLDQNFDPDTSPLPIQLLFFSVNRVEKSLVLEWTTASELNFDYFSVERSSNGTDFIEIFQIKGHGTTKERHNYKLQDNQPLIGKNYYRLKSVDFDGYTEYFNVVVADYSGDKSFLVSPNPSEGSAINFVLNFSPDENSIMVIYDSRGTVIGFASPIENQHIITFSNPLNSGLYYAKMTSKNFTSVEKFIVR